MGEEFIPLVPVFLIVSKKLGYDRIYGMALVFVAAETGFAASTTNPFTVNVAQGIAELPLNSGIPLRLVFFGCAMTVTGHLPAPLRGAHQGRPVRVAHGRTIRSAGREVAGATAYGTPPHRHPGGLQRHLRFHPVRGAAVRMVDGRHGRRLLPDGRRGRWSPACPWTTPPTPSSRGMEEMVVAALVVGFARGISVVLADGQIMDTIVHGAATVLQQVPRYVAVVGHAAVRVDPELLIPSGSGQAAVTMPLMAPLSDILGITRQTAVLAFTCGDGFSNSVIPTSGILMAMLALAKIPYTTWLRFMLPLFCRSWLSAVFLIIAVAIGLE